MQEEVFWVLKTLKPRSFQKLPGPPPPPRSPGVRGAPGPYTPMLHYVVLLRRLKLKQRMIIFYCGCHNKPRFLCFLRTKVITRGVNL